MEDVDGVADVDDFDSFPGANDAGKGDGRDGRTLLAFVFRCVGCFFRRGVEDIDGTAGADDADGARLSATSERTPDGMFSHE